MRAQEVTPLGSGLVEVAWDPPASPPSGQTYEITALPTKSVWPPNSPTEHKCTLGGLEAGVPYSFEVTALVGKVRSSPVPSNEVVLVAREISGKWKTSSLIVSWLWSIAAVTLFVVWLFCSKSGAVWYSLSLATAVVAVAFWLLHLLGGKLGVCGVLMGHDRRISTSKTQVALWTVLIGFAVAYMGSRALIASDKHLFEFLRKSISDNSATGELWSDYLILLGGPFAALVFAKGIMSAKVESTKVQKTVEDDGSASLKQTLAGDSSAPDLVDSQYLLFNLVALVYVVVGLATHGRLPPIPAIILALTSPAAATYVVNKAVQQNAPAVTAVTPSLATIGDQLVVQGLNFMPAGAKRVPTVTIGGVQAYVSGNATDSRLMITVAPGTPTDGFPELVVTTAAHISTQAKTVQIKPS